ncbi:hypothetical protein AKJ09_08900 [Labilithrix luteola]|uniref:Uncharacterized protein n=1 Tax=Labilithrix luteola TaxID=1391654 RepID=A0A0K1Q9A5_9BACT|nr:hypothetical protein [Labilithrix luteola]AKV02237.1 hypothetical protein AKJ09_08900 [Labilithrix luteola]
MATQQAGTSKANRLETLPKRPTVARAEIIDKATRTRFESELDAALKRRPTNEVKLAGALRAVATLSPALRNALAEAAQTMVRRGSYTREIYSGCIRTLAEADDRRVPALLKTALAAEDAGGNATLSAASFCTDASLTAPLAKLAASQKGHLAFGAETARVCRRESNGARLSAIAPMIKESHRIALCVDLFVPLVRSAPVPVYVGPALAVLRGAERHLGRWLVLADVAAKSGDPGPLQEATAKAQVGPTSARAAWSLVAWALQQTHASVTPGAPPVAPPSTRPTVELVARLSDRPSADRDTTFLFRMARARATSCKPMLEGLVKGTPLMDEVSVRAASYLARDHAREDMKDALLDCARNAKRDELRGLAVAALWDTGDASARQIARDLSDELVTSRCISSVAWGALVRAASASTASANGSSDDVVVAETPFRWVQWGWLE